MYFSFVTLSYNHQNFISQHLESIKYQILNYGQEFSFELIIYDDGSTDNTVNIIEKWIEENRILFKSVKINSDKENKGIVHNYIQGLKSISGNYFKILAGDDLYSCSNLFDCVKLLKDYDIVQGAFLEFEDKNIMEELKYFKFYIKYQSLKLEKLNQNAQLGKFIFTAPSFLFRKELITEDLILFLAGFKMCEDQPLFYHLLSRDGLRIKFYPIPIILYRISSSSIARNIKHPAKDILIQDNIKFLKLLSRKTNSVLIEGYFKYHILSYTNSLNRYLYKFNPVVLISKLQFLINYILHYRRLKRYYLFLKPLIIKNEYFIGFEI